MPTQREVDALSTLTPDPRLPRHPGMDRRRFLVGLAAGLATLVLLLPIVTKVTTEPAPRYRASAIVVVEGVRPRITLLAIVSLAQNDGRELLLALLNSRSLAGTVAVSLDASSLHDIIETSYDHWRWLTNARPELLGIDPARADPARAAHNRAITELQRRMRFEARDDGTVTVSADASRPHVAIDIREAYLAALTTQGTREQLGRYGLTVKQVIDRSDPVRAANEKRTLGFAVAFVAAAGAGVWAARRPRARVTA
jgi:uncharacterized protein involved in exopolysaccharide biosynthesis